MIIDDDYEIYNTGGISKASQINEDFWDTNLTVSSGKQIIFDKGNGNYSANITKAGLAIRSDDNVVLSSYGLSSKINGGITLGDLKLSSTGIVSTSSLQIQGDELRIKDTGGVFYIDGAPRISGDIAYGTEEPYENVNIFNASTKKLNPDVYDSGGGTGGITKASQMTGSFWDTKLSVPNGIDVIGNITIKQQNFPNDMNCTLSYDKIDIKYQDSHIILDGSESPRSIEIIDDPTTLFTKIFSGSVYLVNEEDGFTELVFGKSTSVGRVELHCNNSEGLYITNENLNYKGLIINPDNLPNYTELLTSEGKINPILYEKGITKSSEMVGDGFWDETRLTVPGSIVVGDSGTPNYLLMSISDGYRVSINNVRSALLSSNLLISGTSTFDSTTKKFKPEVIP